MEIILRTQLLRFLGKSLYTKNWIGESTLKNSITIGGYGVTMVGIFGISLELADFWGLDDVQPLSSTKVTWGSLDWDLVVLWKSSLGPNKTKNSNNRPSF